MTTEPRGGSGFHTDGQWVQACTADSDPCPRGVRCDYCHG